METERDLTHVKQIPIDMEMLMAVLSEGAFAQVQAVIKMANSAHNKAIHEAADLAATLTPRGPEVAEQIRTRLLRTP